MYDLPNYTLELPQQPNLFNRPHTLAIQYIITDRLYIQYIIIYIISLLYLLLTYNLIIISFQEPLLLLYTLFK